MHYHVIFPSQSTASVIPLPRFGRGFNCPPHGAQAAAYSPRPPRRLWTGAFVSLGQLDMSPDVAGVTFLAFGNGAPDVFSCLAALTTTSGDREAALLVGAGSLLGSGEPHGSRNGCPCRPVLLVDKGG